MHQQLKGLAWFCATVFLGIILAVGLPFLANLIPWSLEKRAAVYWGTPPAPVCNNSGDPQAMASLQTIVRRLYPLSPKDATFPLSVNVLHGPTVNAFAGLGGHVYVYEGLLKEAESPEELAGVLAHEIEHVRRRHILEGVIVQFFTTEMLKYIIFDEKEMGPQMASLLLHLRFSREQEAEADRGGLKRLQAAHVDVSGFVAFFERAKQDSLLSSVLADHPSPGNRAELAKRYAGGPTVSLLSAAEWKSLKTICQ